MAVILSGREVANRLRRLEASLRDLRTQRLAIDNYAKGLEDEGQSGTTIQTDINALLVDWGALRDQIVTDLSAIPILHQTRVKVGMPAIYNAAQIEASLDNNLLADLSAGGAIMPNLSSMLTYGAGPLHAFLQNDVISLSNSEDSSNNKSVKVRYSAQYGGVDLITNGGFLGSTAWTEAGDGGTEIVFSGGKCVFTSATAVLSQAEADMVSAGVAGDPSYGWILGGVYLCTFTLDSVSGGSLSVGTTSNTTQLTVTASGTHKALIFGDNDSAGLLFTATGFTGNLDNVSLIPYNGLVFNDQLGADNSADASVVLTLQER